MSDLHVMVLEGWDRFRERDESAKDVCLNVSRAVVVVVVETDLPDGDDGR